MGKCVQDQISAVLEGKFPPGEEKHIHNSIPCLQNGSGGRCH